MTTVQPDLYKVFIKRAWNDLSPKLLAFLTGGTAATVIVHLLVTYTGIVLEPGLAALLVTLAGTVLGYIKSDSEVVDLAEIETLA